MKNEIKDVPGFEGLYKASSNGYIISCAKSWLSGRYKKIVKQKPETIMKPSHDKNGYPKHTLMKDGKCHYFREGRLVAITFHPNPDNLPQVNHKDGNKRNSRADNVEWVTDGQNKKHAWDTGLCVPNPQPKGESNPKAKLTNDQAAEIRQSTESMRKLGAKYGVHHSIIDRIKKGKAYNENF